MQENSRRQKTQVCEKFDHLYNVLEGKKKEMMQKVTAEQDEKVNYIRGLTRKYGDHLEESCKIVEMGIQTMEEPEVALFLQVSWLKRRNTVGYNTGTVIKVLFFFQKMKPLLKK